MTIAAFRLSVRRRTQRSIKENDIVNVAKRKRETTSQLSYTVALSGVMLWKFEKRKKFDFGNYECLNDCSA